MFSRTSQKGFTLIELLVVLAIIGLLSAIVLSALSSTKVKGKVSSIKTTLTSMRSQIEIGNNNGTYQPDAGYATGVGSAAGCSGAIFASAKLIDMKNSVFSNNGLLTCSVDIADAIQPVTRWAIGAILPDLSGLQCVDSAGRNNFTSGITSIGAVTTTQINNGVCL